MATEVLYTEPDLLPENFLRGIDPLKWTTVGSPSIITGPPYNPPTQGFVGPSPFALEVDSNAIETITSTVLVNNYTFGAFLFSFYDDGQVGTNSTFGAIKVKEILADLTEPETWVGMDLDTDGDNYVMSLRDASPVSTGVARATGWHILRFEIFAPNSDGRSSYKIMIDDQLIATQFTDSPGVIFKEFEIGSFGSPLSGVLGTVLFALFDHIITGDTYAIVGVTEDKALQLKSIDVDIQGFLDSTNIATVHGRRKSFSKSYTERALIEGVNILEDDYVWSAGLSVDILILFDLAFSNDLIIKSITIQTQDGPSPSLDNMMNRMVGAYNEQGVGL